MGDPGLVAGTTCLWFVEADVNRDNDNNSRLFGKAGDQTIL
jgi:hypothetical protein